MIRTITCTTVRKRTESYYLFCFVANSEIFTVEDTR